MAERSFSWRTFASSLTAAFFRPKAAPQSLQLVDTRGGWWNLVRESYAGAWQSNVEVRLTNVLTFSAVYACVTLIAQDIAKLRIKLVEQNADGIWTEVERPSPFEPVLRKPNRWSTHIDFLEQWSVSKLLHGNTYVLKERDQRGMVSALYVLDPCRVRVLVSDDGAVYYELKRDTLSTLEQGSVLVPASEIIHDKYCPLYHPLVGVSPLTAAALAAIQGLRIQENSAQLFGNGALPSGILTAPGPIKQERAIEMKQYWETEFSGANVGKVAVLGGGLKYEAMTMRAVDAQLIEQLRWTAENVCTAFLVPRYMIGVGPEPSYANATALELRYLKITLQNKIEKIETLLDEGCEMPRQLGTELDTDNLLRMVTSERVDAGAASIKSGGVSPNEARKRFWDLGPTKGGESPYMQQQQFSLAALAERDAAKPFSKPATPTPPPAATQTDTTAPAAPQPARAATWDPAAVAREVEALLRKDLELERVA